MNKSILKFKEAIKELAVQQVKLKLQRKTVHLSVRRNVHPGDAASKHMYNRFRLRHMYLAYGFLRGKTLEQIESSSKTNYNKHAVSTFVEKYSPEALRVSA